MHAMKDLVVPAIVEAYPQTQAIYLYGSYADSTQHAGSDVDLAILFPPELAKRYGDLSFSDLRFSLENKLKTGVDLINIRLVSTVFQKEIVYAGLRIFCADEIDADTFEMLTTSFYCKLNEERRAILDEFFRTKRAYMV